MLRLIVNLDVSTLYRTNDGRVGGKICLQVEASFFPETNWADFPVPLLTSWLEAALEIVEGRQTELTCFFLDGPFRATLAVQSPLAWNVSFIEDRLYGPELRRRETFDPSCFLSSLLTCSDLVSKHCSENLWRSACVDQLNVQRRLWHKHVIL